MILDNLVIARAFNSDHQVLELLLLYLLENYWNHFDFQETLIQNIAAAFMEDGPFSMLIIDSMTALLRVDYTGRGELAPRQQKLGQM